MNLLSIAIMGYTIDWSGLCHEPCPKCGHVSVYHVNEDAYKVFCTRLLCDYQDNTFNPKLSLDKMLER